LLTDEKEDLVHEWDPPFGHPAPLGCDKEKGIIIHDKVF
jgi:hypothetical protein